MARPTVNNAGLSSAGSMDVHAAGPVGRSVVDLGGGRAPAYIAVYVCVCVPY